MGAPVEDPFEDYFRSYARAFDAFDAERVASHFHCPCMLVNAGVVALLDTQEAIRRNMEGVLRYHESEEYHHASLSDFRVDRPGETLAIVSVRWRIYKRDDRMLWDWTNSYNLVDPGAGWKILVSTSHDAA